MLSAVPCLNKTSAHISYLGQIQYDGDVKKNLFMYLFIFDLANPQLIETILHYNII